jgi:hypothetical protein
MASVDPSLLFPDNPDVGQPSSTVSDVIENTDKTTVLPDEDIPVTPVPLETINPVSPQFDIKNTDGTKFTGIPNSKLYDAQTDATQKAQTDATAKLDWRVRLSLAPNAKYLYKSDTPGILYPLTMTNGVIFPYTPQINVGYSANYEIANIIHTNYKMYQYSGSGVDQIQLTCDFTAQDTYEANYLLATIHFFRSVTKMFYGNDESPQAGTPPPVCFLYGLGAHQFNNHPLVVTGFSYNLPNNVDYIQAGVVGTVAGVQNSSLISDISGRNSTAKGGILGRLLGQILPGGTRPPAQFSYPKSIADPTYVPTHIQLSISCYPLTTRNQVSNEFSLKEYGNGSLIRDKGFW